MYVCAVTATSCASNNTIPNTIDTLQTSIDTLQTYSSHTLQTFNHVSVSICVRAFASDLIWGSPERTWP